MEAQEALMIGRKAQAVCPTGLQIEENITDKPQGIHSRDKHKQMEVLHKKKKLKYIGGTKKCFKL